MPISAYVSFEKGQPEMSDVTVSVTDEVHQTTEAPAMLWIWDFPESLAPELGSRIGCTATWKPPHAPDETQDLTGAVSSWTKPVPANALSEGRDLIIGASLRLPRRHYRGMVEVELSWVVKSTGNTNRHRHEQTLGNALNTQQSVDIETACPILSNSLVAPLTAEESQSTLTASAEPADPVAIHEYRGNLVQEAIAGIYRRLREGLGPHWRAVGPHCRTADGRKALSEVGESELGSLTSEELDECWAQLISELMVGTCYHGPGAHMALTPWPVGYGGAQHRTDARFFRYVSMRANGQSIGTPNDASKEPDPVAGGADKEYITSLCHACQQLATATLMSRSPDFLELGENPLDCREPQMAGQLAGKTTFIAGNTSQIVPKPTGETLKRRGWLVPGACYFRPQSCNHVGVILRAFQSTKIQMLDTEAWHFYPAPFSKPPTDPASNNYSQLNFDTASRERLPEDLNGVLIPPPIEKAKLVESLKMLRNARPLGCARLVIYRRGASASRENVLYVSRKLFMHENVQSVYRAYSVAALLNSLRGCPHADRLDVRWQIFRPVGTDAVRHACNVGRTAAWWTAATSQSSPNYGATMELAVSRTGSPFFNQRNAQYVSRSTRFDEGSLLPLESAASVNELAALRGAGYTNLANVDNSLLPQHFRK